LPDIGRDERGCETDEPHAAGVAASRAGTACRALEREKRTPAKVLFVCGVSGAR